MTPTGIDLKVIADRLAIVESAVDELRALPAGSIEEFNGDRRNIWAADALLRRAIEALFDTARHMLAKGYGYGSLEYRDVARMAHEKRLVPPGLLSDSLLKIAGFRNRLAHYYDEVTPGELFLIVSSELDELTALAEALRTSASRLVRDASRPAE